MTELKLPKTIKMVFTDFDGVITDGETGRSGVLEIKTGTIRRAADWVKWGGKEFTEYRIPQNYYIQIFLHH